MLHRSNASATFALIELLCITHLFVCVVSFMEIFIFSFLTSPNFVNAVTFTGHGCDSARHLLVAKEGD